MTHAVTRSQARRIWLHAQKLDVPAPFGAGPEATPAAIHYLGYVQIDTIHVIERCHHHILFTRIPGYRREHLQQAQSLDKSVFEYWTHALSYLATQDMRYYVSNMRRHRRASLSWFRSVREDDVRRVLRRIRNHGALTIRDIDDDVLVEKDHPWASRKPSKRALQLAFFRGQVTVSRRTGMLKTYELMGRHFGWRRLPAAASTCETLDYFLDRALRTQGLVSVDSASHASGPGKRQMRQLIENRARRKQLVPVELEGAGDIQHWAQPQTLEAPLQESEQVHILSPFDPLVMPRRRLRLFFGYEHRFEAYVPRHKRVFGYFACPVLVGEQIVAALDLKADRERGKLRVQKWSWVGRGTPRAHKQRIEAALHTFERFQLAGEPLAAPPVDGDVVSA